MIEQEIRKKLIELYGTGNYPQSWFDFSNFMRDQTVGMTTNDKGKLIIDYYPQDFNSFVRQARYKKFDKKELTLNELHKKNLRCVFCGVSSRTNKGGYYKNKFICKKCDDGLKVINYYLEG